MVKLREEIDSRFPSRADDVAGLRALAARRVDRLDGCVGDVRAVRHEPVSEAVSPGKSRGYRERVGSALHGVDDVELGRRTVAKVFSAFAAAGREDERDEQWVPPEPNSHARILARFGPSGSPQKTSTLAPHGPNAR